MNLTEAEMSVMNILWEKGETKAGEISNILIEEKGWKKNTTYTLINRLLKKEAIERVEPGYLCRPLLLQGDVQISETKSLLDRMYNGSFNLLVQNFIKKEQLSKKDLEEIKKMIEEMEAE